MKRLFLTAILIFSLFVNAYGEVSFESEILPILQAKCSKCHGEEKQNSDLRLDTTEGIIKGGGSGEPLMVKGDAEASLFINFINSDDPDEKMPPEGEQQLTIKEKNLLSRWVNEGASMPLPEKALKVSTDHWSFQKVQRPDIPQTKKKWGATAIDNFVLQKMISKGLGPSIESNPQKLIRRIYQIMHGIPPSEEKLKPVEYAEENSKVEKRRWKVTYLNKESSFEEHERILAESIFKTKGGWQCSQCPYARYGRSHVIDHATIHFEGFLFTCSICEKKYNRKKTLGRHFECDVNSKKIIE